MDYAQQLMALGQQLGITQPQQMQPGLQQQGPQVQFSPQVLQQARGNLPLQGQIVAADAIGNRQAQQPQMDMRQFMELMQQYQNRGDERLMPIMTTDQLNRLKNLPKPPALDVRLVDPRTGLASPAFVDYLQRLDDWHRKVLAILGE